MPFRLAQLRHLFSVVFLLGALALVSVGSLSKEARVFASIDQTATTLVTDASSDTGSWSMAKQPLQPSQDGDGDHRCAAEDNSFDDTLELPDDLVVNLPLIAAEYSSAPAPELAGAPLATVLRPPIA